MKPRLVYGADEHLVAWITPPYRGKPRLGQNFPLVMPPRLPDTNAISHQNLRRTKNGTMTRRQQQEFALDATKVEASVDRWLA